MKCPGKSFAGIIFLQLALSQAVASEGPEGGVSTARPSDMSAEQRKAEQQYFAAHSFEFSSIFKRHHPGPYWILANAEHFRLSAEQAKRQETLKLAMARATISGNVALRKAYEKYASDASAAEPSRAVVKKDIEAIGKAQTHLAQVMVPFHLDAYAALNPAQRETYRRLAAEQ